MEPLMPKKELEQLLAEDGSLPFRRILEPNIDEWGDNYQLVFGKISESANGGRLFKTLTGHLDMTDFESAYQAELQVVEFIRFYGDIVGLSRTAVETISKNTIQATPISGPNNEIWTTPEKAKDRVSYLYDTLLELDEAEKETEGEAKNEPHKPTSQNLDNLNMGTFSNRFSVTGSKNDELLGK